MTENEAKNILIENRPFTNSELQEAVCMAIQALEEVQAYRAIGTVEDVTFYRDCHVNALYEYCGEERTDNCADNCGCKGRIKYLEKKVAEFEAIGTVEELKQLKENGAFTGLELAELAAMQMKLKEYQSIGTLEECRIAVEVKNAITEIVNRELIAGRNNYKEIYDCFYEIVKVIQDNY